MAKSNLTIAASEPRHIARYWGELIYASKSQIQNLGIGVSRLFPGEPNGPKRAIRALDPRGYECVIAFATRYHPYDDEQFVVSISYPGRRFTEECHEYFSEGITRSQHLYWCDDYIGSENDLVAAKIVSAGLFPGRPEMQKHLVPVLPDGTRATGRDPRMDERNSRTVKRIAGGKYLVRVRIGNDESEARRDKQKERYEEYESKIETLPRIHLLRSCLEKSPPRSVSREHIKLAYSAS